MKKLLVIMLLVCSVVSLFANGASEATTASTTTAAVSQEEIEKVGGSPFENTVKITFMNSKPEITEALEKGAKKFGEKFNVEIEISETSSPTDAIAQRYAAGDAPTILLVDGINIRDIYEEKLVDLSDEPWASVGGEALGIICKGKLYGMPVTVEGTCILYNKTAIEKTIGREFDPAEVATLDGFNALLAELKAGGMEYPVVLNAEDWSIGIHASLWMYTYQDGTEEGAAAFLQDVYYGKTTFEDNDVFNAYMDTLDVFIANNINHNDPLAADYDLNASYVAEGEAAFWVNGTWGWPDFEPYVTEGSEYGVMGWPINGHDDVAGRIICSATKYIGIDRVDNDEDQQKAAKMFLNWLVFTDEGQSCLVNDCEISPAFTNITLEMTNPFNTSLKSYVDRGLTVDTATYLQSDIRSATSSYLQAYLGGKLSRLEVAELYDAYWKSHLATIPE